MPSYEIVIDTTAQWDAFPTLNQGFKLILMDEGRHITFGTEVCRILIEKDPSYEEAVHEIFDAYRGNVVGLVEYQKARSVAYGPRCSGSRSSCPSRPRPSSSPSGSTAP